MMQRLCHDLQSLAVAHSREGEWHQHASKGSGPRVFCGHVPKEVNEELVKTHFSQWGVVTDVYFPRHKKTLKRRPFCFVSFASFDSAERAVAESPLAICGIPIKNLTIVEDRNKYYQDKHSLAQAALVQALQSVGHTFSGVPAYAAHGFHASEPGAGPSADGLLSAAASLAGPPHAGRAEHAAAAAYYASGGLGLPSLSPDLAARLLAGASPPHLAPDAPYAWAAADSMQAAAAARSGPASHAPEAQRAYGAASAQLQAAQQRLLQSAQLQAALQAATAQAGRGALASGAGGSQGVHPLAMLQHLAGGWTGAEAGSWPPPAAAPHSQQEALAAAARGLAPSWPPVPGWAAAQWPEQAGLSGLRPQAGLDGLRSLEGLAAAHAQAGSGAIPVPHAGAAAAALTRARQPRAPSLASSEGGRESSGPFSPPPSLEQGVFATDGAASSAGSLAVGLGRRPAPGALDASEAAAQALGKGLLAAGRSGSAGLPDGGLFGNALVAAGSGSSACAVLGLGASSAERCRSVSPPDVWGAAGAWTHSVSPGIAAGVPLGLGSQSSQGLASPLKGDDGL